MPIRRDEFESGQIDRERRILEFLSDQRNRGYSKEELLRVLNYQVSEQGVRGPRELLEALGDYATTTEEQFIESIGALVQRQLVESKVIEGSTYYIAAVRPPA